MLFVELKAPHVNVYNAFQDNFRDYKSTIQQLFWYNAFVVLSNGGDAKIGSVSANWEHFGDWKKISSEGEEGIISLDTMIRGTCDKNRFMDIHTGKLEGVNNKIKVIKRKAYGFHDLRYFTLKIYQAFYN